MDRSGRTRGLGCLDEGRPHPVSVEKDAFIAANLRVFCLTSRGLRGEDQTARFVDNLNRILQRCRQPGPYIYGVYPRRLERIWPETK